MGVTFTSRVWDSSPCKGKALLALLALADWANEDGIAWPSIAKLAQRIRVSERSAQRLLAQLEDDGYLRRVFRGGHATLYQIFPLPSHEGGDNNDTLTKMSPRGVKNVTPRGVKNVTQIHHIEPSIEPSSFVRTAKPSPKGVKENAQDDFRPDPLWVAFANEVSVPATRSGRRSWSIALADLRNAGATAESVSVACHAYRQRWPKMTLTPFAIAKYWHLLKDGRTHEQAEHQQSVHRTATDSARREARRAFDSAYRDWVWKLDISELDTPNTILRNRFAREHPELATACDFTPDTVG